jgi:hypothetical protein
VPIPFAPPLGLALGAALAWIAGPALGRHGGPIAFSAPFAVVVAFAVLLWLPVLTYFVCFHGDWAYLYLVPWLRVPSALDLAMVLLSVAAVVAGFWLSARPLRERRVGPVVAMVVAPGSMVAVGLAVAARRLAVSATYAQFHGDFGTEPIGASTLGKGVLLMGVLTALGLAWTARTLARMAADA